MKIELRPLADITPYENNPRINDQAVDAVAASLREFGFRQPIVVDTEGVIVCGHTRYKAALKLGLEKAPVHVAKDLSPAQIKAYRIADNKSGELAEWNFDLLPIELGELQAMEFDLASLGFDEKELTKLLNAGGNAGLTDPDEVPSPPDEATTRPGDLWILGKHRLLCGDSSSATDLDRLLDGEVIHLVNTDPPYNVKVEPRSNNAIAAGNSSFSKQPGKEGGKAQTHHQKLDLARHPEKAKPTGSKMRAKDRPLANDFVTDDAFDALLLAWFGNAARVLQPGGSFYIWGGYANLGNYPGPLDACGLYFSQGIVWDKQHPVLTRKDFMGAFEICFYGWKEGAGHNFYGPNNATDLWHVKKVNPQSMVHLTEKPVELAVRAIQYSSKPGENVLDLFGGSGSTMIACEQQGRRGFLMELDPLYCDVIVQRWEAFTGKKAERVPANAVAEEKAPATAEA
jgi:DNA modification methylase